MLGGVAGICGEYEGMQGTDEQVRKCEEMELCKEYAGMK